MTGLRAGEVKRALGWAPGGRSWESTRFPASDSFAGRLVGHSLPPDVSFRVSATLVKMGVGGTGGHGIGVGLDVGAGGDAEVPYSGLMA